MPQTFAQRYQALVESQTIEPDAAQARVAQALAELSGRLAEHRLAGKASSLGWLFSRNEKKQPPVKGLYIHGAVGRGKTMLMDLFFAASPVARKRRAHFHEFMADVHARVHGFRQRIATGEFPDADPVKLTADALFDEAWLLCFDEFHVTDIADAMILGRLFARLFERGVVVVATSNVAPQDLYRDGLNRALFLPFLAEFEAHLAVLRLDARTDFRLEKFAGVTMWHTPADASGRAALDRAWRRLTAGVEEEMLRFSVLGHVLYAPRVAQGAARFTFAELCERPLGAADYLCLARAFHTLVIDEIPVMDFAQRNAAKRFITLIDTLYDNAVKLIATAATEPTTLYRATEGVEAQEFPRTASRLIEMGSQDYLALPHGRATESRGSGATTGLAET